MALAVGAGSPQREVEPHAYPSRKASWKRTRCARISLNFSQIGKGSYMASLKRAQSKAAAVNITMKSSTAVTCLLASCCMAL